jgi:hypothetical protein
LVRLGCECVGGALSAVSGEEHGSYREAPGHCEWNGRGRELSRLCPLASQPPWDNLAMLGRQVLRRLDAHMERGNVLLARIDGHMERGSVLMEQIDGHMARGNVLMERIDGHMARGNQHMARGNELMQRLEATMADISREMAIVAEEVRLSREERVDMREYMRETFLRSDRRAQAQMAALREVGDESRAQTNALLRLIDRMDRLDPGGSAAAG